MSSKDRIGRNEAVFRDVNERIEAGQWPGEPDKPIAFRCECASLGCNMLIELTHSAYERVRADPRHFALVPGHEIAGVELVVERETAYVVVEKIGEAERAAEETDPRDD
jgi:hypothetical protein